MKQDEEKKNGEGSNVFTIAPRRKSVLGWASQRKKQTNKQKKNKKQNSEFCNQGKRGPIYCLTSGAV